MSRKNYNQRQNALKARALRFESLETREMLDVAPIGFISSTSDVACFSNAVPEQYGAIALTDLSTGAPLANSDTLQLNSYYIDSSGYALTPSYGETVYKRIVVQNTGTETLTITSATLSEGSRVEFVGGYKTSLEPNEETILTLKWQALQAESSTLTIVSDDPDQPTFELDLSGSIRANTTILPSLGAVSLLCDTGASATDAITCNPTVTGAISGNLYGGRVDVEFDLNADSDVDAVTPIYVLGDFTFDPSEYSSAFNPLESETASVTLRYRPAIYNAYGTFVERGAWQTFNYTLEPAPSAALTVSNLAVSANYDGNWTQPNATKIIGVVSGTGERAIQVKINNQIYAYSTSESTFTAPLPVGFNYGVATPIAVRAGQYDAATQRVLYGDWSTLIVTPAPCAIASLALETDDGVSASDNISSDITLVGALANGVGRNYAEVEFTCNGTTLGSSYTDENGEFTFTPKGLPVVNGVASGTIFARAVYRPENEAPIYGASQSIAVTYAPSYSSSSHPVTLSLDNPLATSSTTTSDPRINLSASLPKEYDVGFEYRWKLATDANWSNTQNAFSWLDDELNTDEEATNLYWNGDFTLPALYSIRGPLKTPLAREEKKVIMTS